MSKIQRFKQSVFRKNKGYNSLGCRYGRKVNIQYLEITKDTIVWAVVMGEKLTVSI